MVIFPRDRERFRTGRADLGPAVSALGTAAGDERRLSNALAGVTQVEQETALCIFADEEFLHGTSPFFAGSSRSGESEVLLLTVKWRGNITRLEPRQGKKLRTRAYVGVYILTSYEGPDEP
jgi:hypothetical protein